MPKFNRFYFLSILSSLLSSPSFASPLFKAVDEIFNESKVKFLLDNASRSSDSLDNLLRPKDQSYTVIHHAIKKGNIEILIYIMTYLRDKAPSILEDLLNQKQPFWGTPLRMVVTDGHDDFKYELAEILINESKGLIKNYEGKIHEKLQLNYDSEEDFLYLAVRRLVDDSIVELFLENSYTRREISDRNMAEICFELLYWAA